MDPREVRVCHLTQARRPLFEAGFERGSRIDFSLVQLDLSVPQARTQSTPLLLSSGIWALPIRHASPSRIVLIRRSASKGNGAPSSEKYGEICSRNADSLRQMPTFKKIVHGGSPGSGNRQVAYSRDFGVHRNSPTKSLLSLTLRCRFQCCKNLSSRPGLIFHLTNTITTVIYLPDSIPKVALNRHTPRSPKRHYC